MTTAKINPAINSPGVTRKLNAISLKLAQLVVLATNPFTGNAIKQPIRPPMAAMIADSTRKLANTLRGWKPNVNRTAISGVRPATAAYIVFTAPNTAPTAMIPVMTMARNWRMSPNNFDCWT